MSLSRFLITVAALIAAIPAFGQLPQARLGYVFPPGGQAGTTTEVRVAGVQNLDYATTPRLLFSHPGITAEAVVDPATGAWRNDAFHVTVAADVPPGRYELSLDGFYGASNPRSFRVESRPLQSESADVAPASPATLTTDTPLYGRIEAAADVDAFAFAGETGQTVVIRCDAATLDSPLQPVLELAGPDGRRLGFAGGAFRGDAMLPVRLPASGEYRVRLTDASYRGGADFTYRIEVAARPVVTAVWPLFGKPGTTMDVELLGYNLPGGEPIEPGGLLVHQNVAVTLPTEDATRPTMVPLRSDQADVNGFDYVFREGNLAADPVPIYFGPESPEQERENDSPAGQEAAIPQGIAGRFEKPADADRFVFEAKAGEVIYVEVFAKRYGSPADPVLTIDQVTGPDGQPKERRIAAVDDRTKSLAPGVFDTATDDPLLRFEAPEDGKYRVTLRDRYFASRGDVTLSYRLSLRRPEPDFRFVAVPFVREKADGPALPSGVAVRKGENVVLSVYAFRDDGFTGPIRITAEGLPPGLMTTGTTLGEGQTSGMLVLTAADDAGTWRGPIELVGEAALPAADGSSQTVRRTARVGTIIRSGQNQPTESRLAGPLVVSILDEGLPFRLSGEGGMVRVGQGSQVLVPLGVTRKEGYAEPVAVNAEGLPGDAKVTAEVKPFEPGATQQLARLVIDPQAPPRTYTVSLKGTAKIDYAKFPHRLKRAKTAQEQAAQAFAQADEALKQATAARDEATNSLKAVEAALQAAAEPDKAQATAGVEAAKATLTEREAAVKAAEEARKQAEAAKKAADQAAAEAEKAAASQKIDYASSAPAVTLTVVPAPVTLTVTPASGGQVKRGETVEIEVVAKRQNGFEGSIRLSLALSPDAAGLTAEPVTIEADQSEAALRVTASADAAEGDVPFPAIRAEAGDVRIDAAVALRVVP